MKRVEYSPAALASFDDILDYTLENFGMDQAACYTDQLAERLKALAKGEPPRARPCELLMKGITGAKGLCYYREGQHFLILRESPDKLEVVEIFHGQVDLDAHLQRLVDEG